jgi:hypothetical protein
MSYDPFVAGTIRSEDLVAHSIKLPPEPAGYYELGSGVYVTRFPIFKKPNAPKRWCARVLLGWRWVAK